MVFYCTIEGDYVTGCGAGENIPPKSIVVTQEEYAFIKNGLSTPKTRVRVEVLGGLFDLSYEAVPPTTAEEAAAGFLAEQRTIASDILSDPAMVQMLAMTPAQIDAWLETNMTTIAGARVVIRRIVRVLWYLVKMHRGVKNA